MGKTRKNSILTLKTIYLKFKLLHRILRKRVKKFKKGKKSKKIVEKIMPKTRPMVPTGKVKYPPKISFGILFIFCENFVLFLAILLIM